MELTDFWDDFRWVNLQLIMQLKSKDTIQKPKYHLTIIWGGNGFFSNPFSFMHKGFQSLMARFKLNLTNDGKMRKIPFIFLLTLPALYATSLYNYVLFHFLVEIFSIIIASCIFIIAWNSKSFSKNAFFLFLGIAYLFVGFDDLLHTLAYKGMDIFPGDNSNLATQLWIAARYTECISLLIAPFFVRREIIRPDRVATVYAFVTALLVAAIFHGSMFPDCYVEGSGLTAFKRISEILICLILLGAGFHLSLYRKQFSTHIFTLMLLSIFLTILAELSFIFYIGVYDISNLIGHLFKYLSFYFLYRAMVQTSLVEPYEILFADLKQRESGMKEAIRKLQLEVDKRERAQERLFSVNADLKEAKHQLDAHLSRALHKRNELATKMSEIMLKKSDLARYNNEILNRLRISEDQNNELRKQLSYYFEMLKETNSQLAGIYDD